MDFYETYLGWYESPLVDEATKEELFAVSRDRGEIEERFYKELEFGTAGLRGILGAGTNRMNVYTVRRATQGLAGYLLTFPDGKSRGVCIAYDSRHGSKEFAAETARVLAANGIQVYLFSTLHSVPQLSFALQRLGCMAGVVITASHNPPKYNGYKVYWSYGGQATPEQAAEIYARIQQTPWFSDVNASYDELAASGMIRLVGAEEDEAYYKACETLLLHPGLLSRHGKELAIVYTPLHGSGRVPVTALLARVGVTNVTVVPEQAEPDGAFPTVSAPNPENPQAFDLAIPLAEKQGATVCIATDPDADRLGVCVKSREGSWITLTGNQIGSLLCEHILSSRKAAGTLPRNGVVVKSLVSTRLADAIAARYKVACEDVLTGFRFIAEKIDAYARTGEKTFLFGFEESYGFLAGGLARDKDAVSSAMLVAELCACCKERGMTLYDALEELYQTYGYYEESVKSYTLEGKAGIERIGAAMQALRDTPLTDVAGDPVVCSEDFETRRKRESGVESPIALPRSNVLRMTLESGAWIVVRPSGTEPKLKLYIAASDKTHAAVESRLAALLAAMDAVLTRLLGR